MRASKLIGYRLQHDPQPTEDAIGPTHVDFTAERSPDSGHCHSGSEGGGGT